MAMQFLGELFGGSKQWEPGAVWQDREIRFDVSPKELTPTTSEFDIQTLDSVEDTKGNNGESGELRIRNLRIIWVSKKNKRINISVGLNCVTSINIKDATSRLKGHTKSLYVLTKYQSQRFEFIFTGMSQTAQSLFSTVMAVFKSYDASRLYRELKLRGALIQDGELKLLPQEQTYSRVNGVWNLSSDQGNLGTFFISNVRVVWFASLAESFNVSLPYLQMKSVRIRESKFGPALVLETTGQSGAYVLGFKVDPKETLDYVYKEISSLWQVFAKKPIFGVDAQLDAEAQMRQLQLMRASEQEEDVQIVDAADRGDALAASYYAEAATPQQEDHLHVYNPELGLAVEQLKEGVSLEQLWSVL